MVRSWHRHQVTITRPGGYEGNGKEIIMDWFEYFLIVLGAATMAWAITKAIVWFDGGER
jgi:hypothetical protein